MAPSKGASKKELVLSLARNDPFLRVEEIARQAGTTAPYVRTILSERRVSLSRLRKEYAKEMERRLGRAPLGEPPAVTQSEWALGDLCEGLEAAGPVRAVEVDHLAARRVRAEWNLAGGYELARAERLYRSPAGVPALRRITVSREALVGTRAFGSEKDAIAAIEAHAGGRVLAGGAVIEVDVADAGAAALLRVARDAALVAVRRALFVRGEAVALDELACPAADARIVVNGASIGIERRETFPGAADGELMA